MQFSESELRDIVAAAVLQVLDGKKRDELIKNAIVHLMTPTEHGYGRKAKSPLAEVFEEALRRRAKEIAVEVLTQDPKVTEEVKRLIAEAMEVVFVRKREATVERIADGLTKSLAGEE